MRSSLRLATCVALVCLEGCDTSSADVRLWAPSDHDQPTAAQGQVAARVDGEGADPTLVDLAWRRNCAACHGNSGRGDGPQGAMVRAPDLTRGEWQEGVTDDEIARTIRKGKNKMPAFELPDQVVEGLVKRIRAARAR